MPTSAIDTPGRATAPRLVALVVFALLAVLHTWPLATDPAHLSRNDNGDTLLNTWAIAWVAHQLPRDPVHLFDANIFYPEPLTLGYSEAMLVQGVLAMPILALGGSPVLAFNLLLMAGMALTGWAFCLLIREWTGSWAAAYVGGSLAAFNSHVLVRLPHLQTQYVAFIALMLFALDRLVMSQRVRDALLLGLGFALQGLTSVYLLVFSTWMLIFAAAARAGEWARRSPVRAIGLFVVAAVTAVFLMGPYLFAYYRVHDVTGFERTVDDARFYGGAWVDYLKTGSRLHFGLWAYRFWDRSGSASFPGLLAIVLVGTAIAWPETRRDARLRMCLVAAAGCALVSMLPQTPVYPLLHRTIPLFKAVRVQAHLGQVVLMLLAVAAAFGVSGLLRRLPDRRRAPAAGVVLCALVNLEALRAPLGYFPFTGIPPIYDKLASEPGAVVVEVPFFPPVAFFHNASYMLNSTRHWRPMLNGYSGFRPASYGRSFDAALTFPSDRSLAALHELGVTHVVVHGESLGQPFVKSLETHPGLELLGASGPVHLYRLR